VANEKNVLGQPLKLCCGNTGFTREGFCYVPSSDLGNHSVCAVMTEKFLAFSKSQGNDLTTALPQFQFPGLKPGDKWCLCAARWQEAFLANCAPTVVLSATHQACLKVTKIEDLKAYSLAEL
jgi:uncharacterized protein (DUF2237 family)